MEEYMKRGKKLQLGTAEDRATGLGVSRLKLRTTERRFVCTELQVPCRLCQMGR